MLRPRESIGKRQRPYRTNPLAERVMAMLP